MGPVFRNIFRHKIVKAVGILLSIIVIFNAMIWTRAFYGSMKTYHQGETYLKNKQYIRAITFFDRSIHWYTPFNPYIQRSAEALWKIGQHAERAGDVRLALIAFRTIRSGFYGVSHFVVPGRDWIEKCESKINDLMALEKKGRGQSEGLPAVIIPKNQKKNPPRIFWSIILEIGFLGWVGSVIGFIMFPFRNREASKSRVFPTFIWIGLTVIFFMLWIIGMMKA